MARLRIFLLLSALFGLCSTSEAQLFGPVAVPVNPEKGRSGANEAWWELELAVGANMISRRRLLYTFPSVRNLRPGLAPRIGLKAIVLPKARTRLVLRLDYIQDRGTLQDYRKTNVAEANLLVDFFGPAEVLREQNGDVKIKEQWLRGTLGLSFDVGPLDLTLAFAASGLLSGSQRYEYDYTVFAFQDYITGQVIPLDPPETRQNAEEFYATDPSGGYGAAVFELSWPVSERLRVELEYEQGLHTNLGDSAREEWRQRRSRVGLLVGYRLFSR